MLTGQLYIDNVDAYDEYGIYIAYDGLRSLIQWPSVKTSSVAVNNWYEMDGVEADVSSVVLDSRQVQLHLYANHNFAPSELTPFFSMLRASVYHTYKIPILGVGYTLRYVSNGSVNVNNRFDGLSLTLAEDSRTKPIIGGTVILDFGSGNTMAFNIEVPDSISVPATGYSIDGIDMARFGMTVTQGTLDQMHKFDKVKEALRRSGNYIAGVVYDSTGTVYTQHDDITVRLHIRTDTVVDFWKRWYSFFATVMAGAEHMLQGAGRKYRCYYKSMAVETFVPLANGGIWCDFSVTMAVLGREAITLLGVLDNSSLVAITDDNNTVISI